MQRLNLFQLNAGNVDGESGYCQPVVFCTDPDPPAAPSKPCVKGRINTTNVKLIWGEINSLYSGFWGTGGLK